MCGKSSTNPSPSKYFLFSKTSSRRLEDAFSVTPFVFQDLLKTSSRHLQDLLAILLPKMFSRRLARRLQDVFKTYLQDVLQLCLQDVFKTSLRRLGRQKNVILKTCWRLQYVFTKANVCWIVQTAHKNTRFMFTRSGRCFFCRYSFRSDCPEKY